MTTTINNEEPNSSVNFGDQVSQFSEKVESKEKLNEATTRVEEDCQSGDIKKHGKYKFSKIFFGILMLFYLASLFSGDSPEIEMVKKGHFKDYPNVTIEKGIDNFFGSPKWESGTGTDGATKGKTLVNISGNIMFMEKEVKALLQFVVNNEDSTFEVNALEFNNIPQNLFMINGLLSKMFE